MGKPTATKKQADIVENRFYFARNNQINTFNNFARFKQHYKSKITDTQDYPWQNHLYDPQIFSIIRSSKSRLVGGVPAIQLQATTELSRTKTKQNQQIIDWEFNRPSFLKVYTRMVHSMLLYGKGIVMTGWNYLPELHVQEEDGEGNQIDSERKVRGEINHAEIKNIRITDWFVSNTNIPETQEQDWVMRRWYTTVATLRSINEAAGYEMYKNLDWIEKNAVTVMREDYGNNTNIYANKKDDPASAVIELLECWEKDKGIVTTKLRQSTDERAILRMEDNPFDHGKYPFVDATCYPEDDEYFSMGMIEPLEDLQISLNNILNQYHDSADQVLNNMWLVGNIQVQDWELTWRPNGIIHAVGQDLTQLRQIKPMDTTKTAEAMMQFNKGELQSASGVSAMEEVGMPGASVRGASALQMAYNEIDQNLKFIQLNLEQGPIREIGEQFMYLNNQFLTEDQEIAITGTSRNTVIKIKRDDISADFEVITIPDSSKPKNQTTRLQQLSAILAMADKEQTVKIDKNPIYQEYLRTAGLTDLDSIIPNDMDTAIEENRIMIEEKRDVDVNWNDDHMTHIQAINFALLDKSLPKATVSRLLKHRQTHLKWIRAKDPLVIEKLSQAQEGQPIPGTNIPSEPQQPQGQEGQPMPPQAPVSPIEAQMRSAGQELSMPTSGAPSTMLSGSPSMNPETSIIQ